MVAIQVKSRLDIVLAPIGNDQALFLGHSAGQREGATLDCVILFLETLATWFEVDG